MLLRCSSVTMVPQTDRAKQPKKRVASFLDTKPIGEKALRFELSWKRRAAEDFATPFRSMRTGSTFRQISPSLRGRQAKSLEHSSSAREISAGRERPLPANLVASSQISGCGSSRAGESMTASVATAPTLCPKRFNWQPIGTATTSKWRFCFEQRGPGWLFGPFQSVWSTQRIASRTFGLSQTMLASRFSTWRVAFASFSLCRSQGSSGLFLIAPGSRFSR